MANWAKNLKKKVKKSLSKRRAARKNYKKVAAKSKPGEGSRFKAVEKSAAASGASNPAAVAASVGRKKYGKAKFQKMAAAGRKK
jgi:hypothetical protein